MTISNTIHKIENHVVNKMVTTFHVETEKTVLHETYDLQNIRPQYFITQNIALKESATLKITHDFQYKCLSCDKKTKKIYSGFCYLCLIQKPEADLCLMSPHRCHYLAGTCREPAFGDSFCYQPHYLYLAFTDKYKIGLTRHTQIPTRWIDQGATMASAFLKTHSRHQAGIIEKFLMQTIADKSHWLKMIQMKNERPTIEEFLQKLEEIKCWILEHPQWNSNELHVQIPEHLPLEKNLEFLPKTEIFEITYPFSDECPSKLPALQSLKLEKLPSIEGKILGIKGQYIVLENGKAFNLRNHGGFIVNIECEG